MAKNITKTTRKITKKKSRGLKSQPKLNKKIVVAVIVACALVGGYSVFKSFASTAPYSRLDCTQATSNKGYPNQQQCSIRSIEGSTARAFIAVLGRKPEKSALQYWSNVYSTYRTGPQQTLINKLLQGSEAQTKFVKLSTKSKVAYLYNSVLQRQPDSSGAAYWEKRFKSDNNAGQTIAAFINTSQSITKTQTATLSALASLPSNWRPTRMSKPVSPRGVYSNWNWRPPAKGYSSLEHDLTVYQYESPSSYFWSHQFKFVGGDGGYIGLQSTNIPTGNGKYKKQAIFSIFSAGIAAQPSYCKVEKSGFDGYNTSGSSCIVSFDWVKGRKYHLKTALSSSDSTGNWWSGWVIDTTTGAKTLIGTIKTPKSWTGFGDWSVMWTENYYSTATTCGSIPYSQVRFSTPLANGSIKPVSGSQSLSEKYECSNSKSISGSNGVVQEVGDVKQ